MAYVGWILRFEFYFQVKSLFKKQVYHQKKKKCLYQRAEEFDPVSDHCSGTILCKSICKHSAVRQLMGGGRLKKISQVESKKIAPSD